MGTAWGCPRTGQSIWRLPETITGRSYRHIIRGAAFERAEKENFIGTDESVLVERDGTTVFVVEGSYENIKITTPDDIIVGEAYLRKERKKIH